MRASLSRVRASLSVSGAYATVEARAEELRDVLVTSALFGDAAWEDDVLDDIVAELTMVVVRGGEVIVGEGEPSDDLLLVVSGRLRVVRAAADGKETVLTHIGRGETVGELGLITRDRRSATVYAIRDSVLARLTRDGYDRLCRRHPTRRPGPWPAHRKAADSSHRRLRARSRRARVRSASTCRWDRGRSCCSTSTALWISGPAAARTTTHAPDSPWFEGR